MDSSSLVQDDPGLWDELDHQQSREIQQHYSRHADWYNTNNHNNHSTAAAAPHTTNNTIPIQHTLQHNHPHHHWIQQTTTEVARVASVFYHAAAGAWAEQRHQRQHESTEHEFWNDYGIPTSHSMPTNEHERMALNTNNNNDADEPGFVFVLPHLRFQGPSAWGAVANLDLYFTSLYQYFYHRGWLPLVAQQLVEFTTLVLTLILSVLLCLYVDWTALATCKDETTCRDTLGEYLVDRPFHQKWTLWTRFVALYACIFVLYTVVVALSAVQQLQEARRAKWVFEERLGISAQRLAGGAVDWDHDVVTKLLELQQSGDYKVAIHGQDLDALVIAQRILRKENFMVALFNRGLLDLSVPGVGNALFCPSLEWSLYFCILNFMFNHKYEIRPAFYLDPAALRRRFVLCGIAHLVFMPFLLFFLMLYFGLQNAYDFKNTKQYLGPKDWTKAAKWTFREFNELQHHFERRIVPSYPATEDYLKLFGQSEIIAAIGRILVFIGGSLGAVLFAFAAMNDAILLHVKIADWNLLWYAGIVGAVYSCGKAMIPTAESQPRSSRNLFKEINQALDKVASHTHHYPTIWKGRGHDATTQKAVSSMFRFKAQNFAMEVLALILSPYILCVSLAKCAEPICEFVLAVRAQVAGAGDICGFATFDFDVYCDESWSGRTLGNRNQAPLTGTLTESIMQTGNVDDAVKAYPTPMAKNGKMEHSFFSFRASHPSWKCSASGQHLVDQAEQDKEREAALRKERELHIEAASKQLNTLAKLERPNGETSLPNSGFETNVDEAYIQPTQQSNQPPDPLNGQNAHNGGDVLMQPVLHPHNNGNGQPRSPGQNLNGSEGPFQRR